MLALLAMHPEGLSLEHLHALRLRRPGGHPLDAQGRGVPPALGARRPARLAALPADDAGRHRRRAGARPAPPRPGGRGRRRVRRRPAARHQLARRSPSSPSTSPSRSARRCWPTRSPTPCVRYSELAPYDTEVVEVCLAALGAAAPPRRTPAQGPAAPPLAGRDCGSTAVSTGTASPDARPGPAGPHPTFRQPAVPSVTDTTGPHVL